MLPRILSAADGVGFRWAHPDNTLTTLSRLFDLPEAEPEPWLATHLEALDEMLIGITGRHGAVLGGEERPDEAAREALSRAYVAIDRACLEYADALHSLGPRAKARKNLRAGQIVGTAALIGVLAREVIGLVGPSPFDGELDRPDLGAVGGFAGLHTVDPDRPWLGARWLVVTDSGRRFPATLSMLLFDSSGVDKEATLREHRDALRGLTSAVADGQPADGPGAKAPEEVEPMAASGALDWLLFDWCMAHRESDASPAVEIRSGLPSDALMLVEAAAASVRLRRRYDPSLAVL